MRIFNQMAIGLGAGCVSISAGFMVEKLFLEEWPWWAWGLMTLPGLALIAWGAWRQASLEREIDEAKELPAEAGEGGVPSLYAYRLKRHRQTIEFLSKNMSWIYILVMFFSVFVLVPLVRALVGGGE